MTRISWATSLIIGLSGVTATCSNNGIRSVNGTSNSTTSASGPVTVNSTILILTIDDGSSIAPGLEGYGIPYEVYTVPQNNAQLPVLNDTANHGNYGGIIVNSEVTYDYSTGWFSAFNATQWDQIYAYQENFGVRMVRLDVFPSAEHGTTTAISGAGCCNAGVEQLVRISDASEFPTANINTNQGMSTEGLWHYPAIITNTTIAKPVMTFDPSGSFTNTTVAAVINDFGNRKQMVVYMSWALQWSTTCAFLQHSYVHWMTRGLFVGKRKVYLNTQIDDMHLETDIYYPNGTTFRVRPADLDIHKSWMTDINSRLPTGSSFKLEVCQNGNGAIDNATDLSSSNNVCFPDYAVNYNSPADMPPEWVKPLGTGTNLWPAEWTTYNWTVACNQLDDIYSWWYVPANQDAFFHITHTFTHLEFDNATYHDAALEIQFNKAWLKQIGIYNTPNFSPLGLVPPAITGLHNGDVIKAWMDNGLKWAIGDNTRPALRSNVSQWYPIRTTVAANGYDGLYIIPRWATTIYYNCDTSDCTLQEWINTSAGHGTFSDLLLDAKTVNTFHLLGLHPDPFMFHQANMRAVDMPQFAVGNKNVQSLLQIWVETVAQEMTRLTNWPIVSLKNDDIAQLFIDRMTLDGCTPNMSYQLSDDRQTITGVEVTANGNSCSVPIPVTFPGTATTSGTATSDKLGSEPLIMWTSVNGLPVKLTLGAPVAV